MMSSIGGCQHGTLPRVAPVITVANPGYVLVPKTRQRPLADGGGRQTYLDGTTLDVVLSTTREGSFEGRATLTGTNIDRIMVPQILINLGIFQPLSGQFGPGWLIAAGVLRSKFTVTIAARAPSLLYQDIVLELTLEGSPQQPVDPPVRTRITAVELTLDLYDRPRRHGTANPQLLSTEDKLNGGIVVAESAAHLLPRTKLVLRRAIPHDFPGTLRVQVEDEDDGPRKVTLANQEQPGLGDQVGTQFTIRNAAINVLTGATLYAKGLKASGDDSVAIAVYIHDTNLHGDYVNAFVDPLVIVRWGYAWIYPEFDAALAAGSLQQGDDRNNHMSEVEIIIDTAGFPPGARPAVTIDRFFVEQEMPDTILEFGLNEHELVTTKLPLDR